MFLLVILHYLIMCVLPNSIAPIHNCHPPGNTIPEPVFLCSIEPPSAAYQSALETALAELQREDPSLRVTTDDDTGQLVLAGKLL